MTRTLYINISYRCNSRCVFCAADIAFKQDQLMSVEDVSRLLGDQTYDRVDISGGEPTIHPNFLQIVRLCREHTPKVAVLTHGRSFHNKKFARQILEAGVNSLVIPLYGFDAQTHDAVTQAVGGFDQTIQGFKNLQELRSEFQFWSELKLVLSKYTAPLNRFIYYLALLNFSHAVNQIGICPFIYSQSGLAYLQQFAAPFEELEEDFVSLVEEILQHGIFKLRVEEFPPCFFPERLRMQVHPGLKDDSAEDFQYYADNHHPQKIAVNQNVQDFKNNVRGNVMIQSCGPCRYRNYCSRNVSSYFSPAYLTMFGEREFRPVYQSLEP